MTSRPRILVVDDNDHNREYAQQVLLSAYEVTLAEDGVAALAAVAESPPDLIVLDLSMPRLDGWGVLRALKDDPAGRGIPVIACTAHAMRGDTERALAAGFDTYLTKPYRPEELLACVQPFVGAGVEPADDADDGWGGDDWSLSEADWEGADA